MLRLDSRLPAQWDDATRRELTLRLHRDWLATTIDALLASDPALKRFAPFPCHEPRRLAIAHPPAGCAGLPALQAAMAALCTGQPLLQADRLPHQVMFIAEGLRLIADDPATGPFTLARLGSGDAVGWCGLVRNQPREAAIAMELTLVAALPAKQFLQLLPQEMTLQQGCPEPNRSELAELLLAWLARQPQRYDDLPGLPGPGAPGP